MPGLFFLQIASGASVSSAAFLDRALGVAIFAASAAAAQLSVEFATATGGEFAPLFGAPGGSIVIASGSQGWFTVDPPTPILRVSQSPPTTAVRSLTVLPINR